tara:strand:- start:589 stop:768 length:180 start_codon:yes stop_codon:yes gene_type:complete
MVDKDKYKAWLKEFPKKTLKEGIKYLTIILNKYLSEEKYEKAAIIADKIKHFKRKLNKK